MPKISEKSIPGPISKILIDELAAYECPAITGRKPRSAHENGLDSDPIVFSHAEGVWVFDADHEKYLDMGASFAVCAYGHCHPELIETIEKQARKLMHGMGDVYPSTSKIAFLKALADFCPGNLTQSILSQSGGEAIESAAKTAQIASGKSHFIAFKNAYHGLSYGALSLTSHHERFKTPFKSRISSETTHLNYPYCLRCPYASKPESCGFHCLEDLRKCIQTRQDVAAVIAEPIQGRGGDIVPPKGWLSELRKICTDTGVLLILDEIYTGFGRTGATFACNHEEVIPDILCLGKAMTGAFPLSAAIASPELMQKWGSNDGEAIHTSTFLGNPLGCALGLKSIELQSKLRIAKACQKKGAFLKSRLDSIADTYKNRIAELRGKGLMWGLEIVKDRQSLEPDTHTALKIVQKMLQHGVIMLPSGPYGQTLSLSPPLIINEDELDLFTSIFEKVLSEVL